MATHEAVQPATGSEGGSTDSSAEHGWRALLTQGKEVFDAGKVWLGVVAALIYAAVRVYYNSFYGHLGVSPEEVGLSYGAILTQAVISLVAAAILLSIFLSFVVFWDSHAPFRSIWGRSLSRVFILVLVGVVPFLVPRWQYAWPLVITTWLALVAAACVLWRRPLGRLASVRPAVAVMTLGFVLLIFYFSLTIFASSQATNVKVGEEIDPAFAQVSAGIRVTSMCVKWLNNVQPPSLDLSRPLMYLGERDGEAVLFRWAAVPVGSIRLAQSNVVLVPTPSSESC